jgi:hypothetical protein
MNVVNLAVSSIRHVCRVGTEIDGVLDKYFVKPVETLHCPCPFRLGPASPGLHLNRMPNFHLPPLRLTQSDFVAENILTRSRYYYCKPRPRNKLLQSKFKAVIQTTGERISEISVRRLRIVQRPRDF